MTSSGVPPEGTDAAHGSGSVDTGAQADSEAEVSEVQRAIALAVAAPDASFPDVIVLSQAPDENQLNDIGKSFLESRKPRLWTALRKQYPDWKPKISGLRLPGAKLVGLDFSDCELPDFSAIGAKLILTNFARAKAPRMEISGADAGEADFTEAIMPEIRANGTNLSTAKLNRAKFPRGRFIGANLSDIREVDGADFDEANLSGVTAIDTDFSKANITIRTIRGGMITCQEQIDEVQRRSAAALEQAGKGFSWKSLMP